MKMKIDSTSLDRSTGTFTPSFNQRTMTTFARVKDGQTTMVAGVSQDEKAARQELNEGPVVERRDQVYALDAPEQAVDRLPHLRI